MLTIPQEQIDSSVAPFVGGSFVKKKQLSGVAFIGVIGDSVSVEARKLGYIPGVFFSKFAKNGFETVVSASSLELINESTFNELKGQIQGS